MQTSVQVVKGDIVDKNSIEDVAKLTRNYKVGRPRKITPEILARIEEAWANGANDLQACFIGGIGEQTLRDYIARTPEYQSRKDAIKGNIALNAKYTIAKAVKRDPHLALDVIERLEKNEWSLRTELTGAEGAPMSFTFVPPSDGR